MNLPFPGSLKKKKRKKKKKKNRSGFSPPHTPLYQFFGNSCGL